MKLTLNQAAKECGRAKSTISKAIKSGKLSAEQGVKGSYLIDTAELFRVFPQSSNNNQSRPTGNIEKHPETNTDLAIKIGQLEAELKAEKRLSEMLSEQVEKLETDRDDWKEQAKTLLLSNHNKPQEARRGFLGLFRGRNQA